MRARVLVVDDNDEYLAGIRELLECTGYEAVVANSFESGKRELRNRAPDLLILDVRLGAFNGLQLISTGQVRIPAIVVTGFEDEVLRADARAFGASYLVKPVDSTALLALIEEQLTTARPQAAARPSDGRVPVAESAPAARGSSRRARAPSPDLSSARKPAPAG